MASGTTSGTGALEAVGPARTFDLALDFGSGSMDLEVKMPTAAGGGWIKTDQTAITADYYKVFESPTPVLLRWNCTAHTTAIGWKLQPGVKG